MNNPPAFPAQGYSTFGGQGLNMVYAEGMTLRDYFAAKAIQAILTSPSWMENKPSTLAKMSYEIADAMLKARTE